ncbi:MAG TPA: efflux RND transporter permease subunit [Polyangiaceae bacterium]
MNLADVSIRRPVFATMLIAAFMVFGLLSYPKVGVDLNPDIDFPYVTVTVVYPGTDPGTMEREVAEKLEESVNTLGGIRALRSYNLESTTQLVIEFELEVNGDKAVQDVRDKVSRILRDLPPQADPPIIEKFDIGAAPIMYLALSGNIEARKLTRIADKTVKERLQRIRGVGSVDVIGGRDREIQVYIDPDKLNGLGLSTQDLAQTIAAQNIEVPAGSFESGTRELTVKTKGQLVTAEDVANIVLPTRTLDNRSSPVVRVSDVARVIDGTKEARSGSTFDGKPAIALAITKQSGANTVAIADAVRREVADLTPLVAQQGAGLTIATDSSTYIARSIHDVQFDLAFGAVLAVVVIFFFLVNARATFISALAIPTSVIATFAFVYWMKFTFNNMTMLALSLAIGVLVDDAIVVMENIHRHLEEGKSAVKAAGDATSEIFLAVLSMTSSILAVFVPVAVMKGIVGRFFLQFGLTVAFAVAMSMLVSFTLTPMMSSKLLSAHKGESLLARAVDAIMSFFERVYSKIIQWALSHRAITLLFAGLLLVGSGFLVTKVPVEFLPSEDRSQFQVTVELPTGTSLEASTKYIETIADDIRKNGPGVSHTLLTVGGGKQGQINKGDIQVNMVPVHERKVRQGQLMAWLRQRYSKMAPATITVSEIGMGGGPSQPIQLLLQGDDLDELARVSGEVVEELKKLPGFVDVDTSYRGGKPEVAIHIDRERASALGVPVASIAQALRMFMAGDAVSELKEGTDAYDIIVQLPKDERSRVETLSSMRVRSSRGELVDLANLVTVTRETGPNRIERIDRQRQVTVLANLDKLPLGTARVQAEAIAKKVVPAGMHYRFEGMGRIMTESFGYMMEALFLAVVLVYMILAAQFNSFIQPVTIMLSLPLSVIGAFGALYLSGLTLSIYSMIGIIMLMGLVTKNAILLVDFANQARDQGQTVHDALVQAGVLRLRPILMTTVAMVFGMLPVALALGEGGEARAPMAVCVIGGLITSTLLTLVVVPVVYTLFQSMVDSRLMQWLGRKLFSTGDESHQHHAPQAEGSSAS